MLAKHRYVLTLPLLALSLNSCGSSEWKQISEETFKKEVSKIDQDKIPEIKTFTVNGLIASTDEEGKEEKLEFKNYTVDPESTDLMNDPKALAITLIVGIFSAPMFAEGEISIDDVEAPLTYYSNSEGWKAHAEDEDDEITFVWNTYGYLISLSDGGKGALDFTVDYEYKTAK